MADGHTSILRGRSRTHAHRLVDSAPEGSVLKISPPRRSLDQNDKMWAMLTDIAMSKPEGRSLTPKVWKTLFMHDLDHELRFEMALDGKGMVPIDYSTSQLTKERMSDLIEKMYEYGARHGVQWSEPQEKADGR